MSVHWLRSISILLMTLTLAACGGTVATRSPPAARAAAPARAPLTILHVSPRHVNFSPVAGDAQHTALTVAYVFPLMTGQIIGHPGSKQAWSVVDRERAAFDLPLKNLLVAAPEPLTADARKSGVHIDPDNTRVLRVATLVGDAATHQLIQATVGFRDSQAGDQVMVLVYVDRPCRMTGSLTAPEGQLMLDITLSSPGFHWLSFPTKGAGDMNVRAHEDTDTVLLVVSGTPFTGAP
jgi:hypothetical protein